MIGFSPMAAKAFSAPGILFAKQFLVARCSGAVVQIEALASVHGADFRSLSRTRSASEAGTRASHCNGPARSGRLGTSFLAPSLNQQGDFQSIDQRLDAPFDFKYPSAEPYSRLSSDRKDTIDSAEASHWNSGRSLTPVPLRGRWSYGADVLHERG